MTDNEIIKALHCKCGGEMICISCPYYARYPDCDRYAARDALSLIHRQQARVEALEMDNEQLQSDIVNANMNAEHALAEIERLQGEVDKQYEIAEANVRFRKARDELRELLGLERMDA